MHQYWIYLISGLMALVPAIFWLVIWYLKDYVQPEPKQLIARSFFFGMMGILPFLGISHVLQHSPNIVHLWSIFSKKTFFLSVIILNFILAFLEEFIKHFAVLRLTEKVLNKYLDQIVDGIIYSVSAALGFAFAENVFYFVEALFFVGINGDFLKIFTFRSFGTMLGHTIFSGTFGLFWGYAFLEMKDTHSHYRTSFWFLLKKMWKTIRFHIIINHVILQKPFDHEKIQHEKIELIAEGLLFATILHAIFNILIKIRVFGYSFAFLVVPILFSGFIWLSKRFLEKRNIKIWK